MKNILCLLTILFMFLNCERAKEESKSPHSGYPGNDTIGKGSAVHTVTIALQPSQFEIPQLKDSAFLAMTNNTAEPIMTGESYSIEFYEGGQWKALDAFQDLAFLSIGYLIAPGESKKFEINFLAGEHGYVRGRYRVVKYYVVNRDTVPKISHNLYSEFVVD